MPFTSYYTETFWDFVFILRIVKPASPNNISIIVLGSGTSDGGGLGVGIVDLNGSWLICTPPCHELPITLPQTAPVVVLISADGAKIVPFNTNPYKEVTTQNAPAIFA
jgi:hypothetical protein